MVSAAGTSTVPFGLASVAAGRVEEPHRMLDEVRALPAIGRAHQLVHVEATRGAFLVEAGQLHGAEEEGAGSRPVATEVDFEVGDVMCRPGDRVVATLQRGGH